MRWTRTVRSENGEEGASSPWKWTYDLYKTSMVACMAAFIWGWCYGKQPSRLPWLNQLEDDVHQDEIHTKVQHHDMAWIRMQQPWRLPAECQQPGCGLWFETFLCYQTEIQRGMSDEQGAAQRHREKGETLPQVRSKVVILIHSLLHLEDDHCSSKTEL